MTIFANYSVNSNSDVRKSQKKFLLGANPDLIKAKKNSPNFGMNLNLKGIEDYAELLAPSRVPEFLKVLNDVYKEIIKTPLFKFKKGNTPEFPITDIKNLKGIGDVSNYTINITGVTLSEKEFMFFGLENPHPRKENVETFTWTITDGAQKVLVKRNADREPMRIFYGTWLKNQLLEAVKNIVINALSNLYNPYEKLPKKILGLSFPVTRPVKNKVLINRLKALKGPKDLNAIHMSEIFFTAYNRNNSQVFIEVLNALKRTSKTKKEFVLRVLSENYKKITENNKATMKHFSELGESDLYKNPHTKLYAQTFDSFFNGDYNEELKNLQKQKKKDLEQEFYNTPEGRNL